VAPLTRELVLEVAELGVGYAKCIGTFWGHVEVEAGHWLWTGAVGRDGYGRFKYNGQVHSARAVAWQLARHALAPRQQVRSDCGRRLCVRPDHLHAAPAYPNEQRAPASLRTRPHASSKPRPQAVHGGNGATRTVVEGA